MRKSMIEAAALAALLLGAALACGQPPGPPAAPDKDKSKDQPAKSKLEEMIDKALRDNPDVRLAAAKAAEADAELSRARLLVVQKVASAYQAVEAQKAAVESAAAELEEAKTHVNAGREPPATQRQAEQKLIDAKAKLAQLEAEVPYLLGQGPAGLDDKTKAVWTDRRILSPPANADAETMRRWYLDMYGRLPTPDELSPKTAVQGPAADRLRAALDKPFTYDNKGQFIDVLIDALNHSLSEDGSGLMIKNTWLPSPSVEVGVNAKFDHMPIGAVLEFVEDTLPGYRAVVRDYGVVIVRKDDIPPGAPLLREFWKGAKPEDKDAGPKGSLFNPPPVLVEGQVTEVANDGLVRVSVGSDAGLAKGQTLEVFRPRGLPGGNPLYVIRLRIDEIGPAEAWGRAVFRGNGYPQPGDHVTSQFTGAPPGKTVEGQVKDVDKDGRIHISMGKNAGLSEGDMLTVYRQEDKGGRALLVGDFRVVEVREGDATAATDEKPKTAPQPGDKVRFTPKDK